MTSQVETHENLCVQKCQIAFDSQCFPNCLKEVNQSKKEALVKTVFNLQKNTTETDLDFINNENNLVYALKEVNISCALSKVPKALFNLKYLTVLNLSNNSIECLPKEIGNLCNLVVLKLSGNKLYCLPKSLKNVQQLNYLDISRNNFSLVPDVLYYSVGNLRVLDLSYNKITIFNDSPGCLNKLVVLKMSNNFLNELPFWIFNNLCQLQCLDVSENRLHFLAEPVNYFSTGICESLQVLNIENCNLSSDVIQILSLFKNLNILQVGNKICDKSVGRNYMGNLKSNLFNNFRKLKYLYLQNTQIATLPSDFDCLKSLEVLDLSGNLLSWLPECFCNLINLKIINLVSNQLLFLPNNIGNLVNLKQIHLANNKLYQIPDSFRNLTNLEFIDLYNNEIEKIDANIFKENQLRGIDLGLNCLNFDFCGCSADVDEVKMVYNFKKDSFRQHFNYASSRSDSQIIKLDGGLDDRHSDSRSGVSSFEGESFSDLEDTYVSMEQKVCNEYENWEENESSPTEADDLFDPNELIKFDHRRDFWGLDFRNNYCPSKYHMPSVMKTRVNFSLSSENEPVEDGQFDSD